MMPNRTFHSIDSTLRGSAFGLALGLALVGLSAGCPMPTDGADAGPRPVTRVGCDEPVGGIPLSENVLEAEPGFDEALAAIDTSALPGGLEVSGLTIDERALIAYALEMPFAELPDRLDKDELLARGPMGEALVASFASLDPTGAAGFDRDFFRRGFHRFYNCSRGHPATLDDFKAAWGDFEGYDEILIEASLPKGLTPRLLLENPEDHIYVAETQVDGEVRETEIIMRADRDDGSLDFLVYDHNGELMDRSVFASPLSGGSVVSATPYACMTCHVDFERHSFDVLIPTQ